jgi:1-acyl-sn-glycerol-3-phosphate acyltransferase
MAFLRGMLVVLSTIFYGSVSLAVSFFDAGGRSQLQTARRWARSLLWIAGARVAVEGRGRIRPEGSYVISPNHVSYMDTPVILANIPVQFRFLAKRGLFQVPFLGTHLARAGHIPVPREDPRAAVKTLTLAAQTIRDRSISMLIFPEGGRTHDGALQPFKEGAAYIAIKAGVPIVPVALIGTRAVLPYGSGRLRPGDVTMRIGDPIETAGMSLRDRGKLTEEVRRRIIELAECTDP